MEEFLKSYRFKCALENLEEKKRNKVCYVFEKLIIAQPELDIFTYIAILDKLFRPDVSYMAIGASKYISSVKIWNRFIVDINEKFELLLFGDNLVY